MKKIIYIIGIIALSVVTILNITFTAYLDSFEHVNINFNSLLYITGLIVFSFFLFFLIKLINLSLYEEPSKKAKMIRISLFAVSLIVYILFNMLWIAIVRPYIVGDCGHVCDIANAFLRGRCKRIFIN